MDCDCVCLQRRLVIDTAAADKQAAEDRAQSVEDALAIEQAVAKTLLQNTPSKHALSGHGTDNSDTDPALDPTPEEQAVAEADGAERVEHGQNQQVLAVLVAVLIALCAVGLGGYAYTYQLPSDLESQVGEDDSDAWHDE